MAENKQNTETENKQTAGGKTNAGGTAASTQQAKESNAGANKTTGQNESANRGGSQSSDLKDTAKDALNQAKETAGTVAGGAIEKAKDKATSLLDDQKSNLASGVASVADSIRQVGENLSGAGEDNQITALAGKYGDNLAAQIEKLSTYLDDKDLRELARDLEQFARRNPVVFVGGAFALGVVAARFLKSSGRRQNSRRSAA